MPHFQGSLVTFAAATLLLNITPGPDMIYVFTRAAIGVRSAGLVSAPGTACGCSVHIVNGMLPRAGAGESRWFRWLTGGVFIGLGLRLAVPESH